MAAGFAVLVIMGLIALTADLVAPYPPKRIDPILGFEAPTASHWFGTDNFGRDVLSRTLHGSRISLAIGLAVAGIASVVGVLLGLLAGYWRVVDAVLMRVMDGLMAIPDILLAMALVAALGASLQNVIISLTAAQTPRLARLFRSTVLSLREWMFVDAARSIGASPWRIMLVHILPNTMAPLIIQASFVFAVAILAEASLSFLGAGVPPIIPSWGNMMGETRNYFRVAPWIIFFPGVALFITVLAVNLIGDGLRDALDPKLRRRA